jgi:hypothetical protein
MSNIESHCLPDDFPMKRSADVCSLSARGGPAYLRGLVRERCSNWFIRKDKRFNLAARPRKCRSSGLAD